MTSNSVVYWGICHWLKTTLTRTLLKTISSCKCNHKVRGFWKLRLQMTLGTPMLDSSYQQIMLGTSMLT